MKSQYEYNKEYRKTHVDQRNAERKRNYDKSRDAAVNGKQPWTQHDDEKVLNSSLTDRQLGEEIGRSVPAIQKRRHRLLGGRE